MRKFLVLVFFLVSFITVRGQDEGRTLYGELTIDGNFIVTDTSSFITGIKVGESSLFIDSIIAFDDSLAFYADGALLPIKGAVNTGTGSGVTYIFQDGLIEDGGNVDIDSSVVFTVSMADTMRIRINEDLNSIETGGSHDQVTLTGTYDYITITDQEITRGQIDLTTDVTGVLPDANVADDITASSYEPLLSNEAGLYSALSDVSQFLEPGDNATNLDGTAWRLFYVNGSGDVTELALGSDGQVLTSTGASTAPAFEDAASGTDNTISGSYDYITLSGQEIVRGQIDLSTDITGDLPVANIDATGTADGTTYLRGDGAWDTPPGSSYTFGDGLNEDASTVTWDSTETDRRIDSLVTVLADTGQIEDYAFVFSDTTGVGKELATSYDVDTLATNAYAAIGTGGSTTVTDFDGTANRILYTDGSGDVQELAFGTDGQVLTATSTTTAPAFEDATGGSGGTGGYSILSFTVGTTVNAPSVGDSLLTHGSLDNAYLDVWRGGQYDAISKQRYRDTLGYELTDSTLMFHPEFADADYVEIWIYDSTDITALALRDTTSDATAPEFSSAELGTYNDTIILVLFDTTDLHQDSVPAVSAFSFYGGNTEIGLNAVTLNEDSLFVALDSTLTVFNDSTLLLSYTKPATSMLQDSTGNEVVAWADSAVTNNLDYTESGESVMYIKPTGDGSALAPLTLNVDAEITLTLSGPGRFYDDEDGTVNESTTWTVASGADHGKYMYCPTDSSIITFSDASQINRFEQGTYEGAWVSSTNAPVLYADISVLSPTTLTYYRLIGNIVDVSDFSDYVNLTYYSSTGSANINNLSDLTYLSADSPTEISGDLSNLSSADYIYILSTEPFTATYTPYTWPTGFKRIYISLNTSGEYGYSVSTISNILSDGSDATWGSSPTIYLSAGHSSMADATQGGIWGDFSGTAAPSQLAIDAKDLVVTKGVDVTLADIDWPEATGDGTGFPTGFGDWWRQ